MSEKWVVEYSEDQDAYHIQTLEKRTQLPVNGYKLLGAFDTIDEADDYLRQLHGEEDLE